MAFRGRTVIVFIFIAIFASSIVTLTAVSSFAPSIQADGKGLSEPSAEAEPALETVKPVRDNGADGLTKEEIRKINTIIQLIESKYMREVDRQQLLDGAIDGMLGALNDPYTVYMDPEEAKSFTENVDSTFSGIGAEVTMEDGRVTVISPIKGAPAEQAGIHAKDIIVSVNGEKLDGLNLNEAVSKIRGPKGTQAKLQIIRPGASEEIQIIVVRDDIDIETVYSELLEGEIGKIEVRQFAQNTDKRFKEELSRLEKKGMKGLIIDVRNNPGGYLFGVLDVLDPLIPEGKTVVQIEYRDLQREQKTALGPGKSYPIVVLTNKGSASASEILAAALQQSAGGILVGETTYGKGTVQTTSEKELGDGSNIKLTIAKWLTPNGTWINEKGIQPDIEVSQPAYYRAAPLSKSSLLKLDSIGEDVKSLQLMLEGLGLLPGRTDGYFSETTAEAVKAFQSSRKLPVTGTVDEATASKIEEAIVKEILDPKNDNQLKAALDYLQKHVK